jgi:hypothetical protein
MFTYATVEDALLHIFAFKEEQRGALRGRIKHFQKLGITPVMPGKGKRITYELHDIYRWALCLNLAEFNIDPKNIAYIDRHNVRHIYPKIELSSVRDFYLYFYPTLITEMSESEASSREPGVEAFGFFYKVYDTTDLYQALDQEPETVVPKRYTIAFRKRHGAINLSQIRRDVDAALAHDSQ